MARSAWLSGTSSSRNPGYLNTTLHAVPLRHNTTAKGSTPAEVRKKRKTRRRKECILEEES